MKGQVDPRPPRAPGQFEENDNPQYTCWQNTFFGGNLETDWSSEIAPQTQKMWKDQYSAIKYQNCLLLHFVRN